MQLLETTWDVLVQVPGALAGWATSLNDGTFTRVMVVGAILLTFAIARALR